MKPRKVFSTLVVLLACLPTTRVYAGMTVGDGTYAATAQGFHGASMETIALRVNNYGPVAVAKLVRGYDDLGFDENGPETLVSMGWAGRTADGFRVSSTPYDWQLPSDEPGQRAADGHASAALSVYLTFDAPDELVASWRHNPGESLADGTLTDLATGEVWTLTDPEEYAGVTAVPITPGRYQLGMSVYDEQWSDSWLEVNYLTIPAPGALGLALMGLLCLRRRRSQETIN
jgi:hypothetical protein